MPDSLLDDIIKALKGEKKSELINQILKEKALHDALKEAGLTIVAEDTHERARLMPYGILSKVQKIDLIDLITEITNIRSIDLIDLITRIDEITTIKTIEAILSLPDITVKGSEGGAFKQASIVAGEWSSPDGFSDPDSQWTDEAKAYDGDVATFCYIYIPTAFTWTSFLYFTLSTPISSNKLSLYLKMLNVDPASYIMDIDVHRDGSWVDVFQGYLSDYPAQWQDIEFGTGLVDQIRLRCKTDSNSLYFGLAEIKLWKLGAVGGELITIEAEKGTVTPFSKTVTADLCTPASGKKIRVWAAFYYSQADIITELRFKTSGNVVLALPTLGSVGMELKRTKMLGAVDEVLEIYLSGAGTVKGWVSVSEE